MKLKELFESTGKSVADLGIEYEGGNFKCTYQGLTSLKGTPDHITGDFFCENNKLTSLEDGPRRVDGKFICFDNHLSSLKGCPEIIVGDFDCAINHLVTLDHAPKNVRGRFDCNNNRITTLKDIHKRIEHISGEFQAHDNPIKSHVLGLLLIKGITGIVIDNWRAHTILNRHLGKGRAGMLQAQEELIEAGLEEFAQL